MNQSCEPVEKPCSECYVLSYVPCADSYVIPAGLTPGSHVYLFIQDKFGNNFYDPVTVSDDGSVTFVAANFPEGIFSLPGGDLFIFISSDTNGDNFLSLNIIGNNYQCIILNPIAMITPSYQIIGIRRAVDNNALDMNSTNKQPISLVGGKKFIVADCVLTNPSINLDTADGAELHYDNNSSSNTIITGSGVLSILSAVSKFISVSDGVLDAVSNRIIVDMSTNQASFYFLLTTPQGASATCDCYVWGLILE